MPRTALLSAGLVIALVAITTVSSAQDAPTTHARRARAMYVTADYPAVLLDDDQVWIPSGMDQPLSVCAGSRCAPVDRIESCEAPDCPGPGARVVLRSSIASVDGFPTGQVEFEAEIQAMRVDSVLSQLSGSFGSHPDSGGGSSSSTGWSPHGAFGVVVASFDGGGGAYAGGTGAIGLRLAIDGQDVWDDGFLESLFGDHFTLAARGSYLLATESQTQGFTTTLGASFEAENRISDSEFAVPAILGALVPEMGAVFRDELPAAFYARWSLPVKLFLSRAAGIELRPSLAVMKARAGGGAETLMSIEIGGFIQ